jgi:DNA-directed RNA polymerase specialized sigma24 family protein
MKELNELVLDYKRLKDEGIFERIYEIVSATWKNNYVVAKSVMSDEHEIQALCEDTLLRCIDQYDGSIDFMHYYRSCLHKRRASLYKVKKRYYKRVEPESNNEDEGTPIAATIECIPDPLTTEEIAFQKQTEADQRQLIGFFLENADDLTTAIIKVALAYQPRQTLGRPASFERQIADTLGIDKRTVKRKLERLAGKFDTKQFGDYRDYLAVAH